MYTVKNYKTKKELKEDLAKGKKIEVYQPNDMFGVTERISKGRHSIALEGPHYPEPHKWYATAIIENGYIVSIK